MAKKKGQETHFAIGRPWNPEDPNSRVAFYAYGSEIFHGTMEDAISLRDQFNRAEEFDRKYYPRFNTGPVRKYRIYQIVEVPGSEDFPSNEPK